MPVTAARLAFRLERTRQLEIVGDTGVTISASRQGHRRVGKGVQLLFAAIGRAHQRMQPGNEEYLAAQIVADPGEKLLVEQQGAESASRKARVYYLGRDTFRCIADNIRPQAR